MRLCCRDCHAIFDEEESFYFYLEPHGELDSFAVEKFAGQRCPECGADYESLAEVEVCRECGRDFEPGNLVAGVLCEDCLRWYVRNQPYLVWEYLVDEKEEFAEFIASKI